MTGQSQTQARKAFKTRQAKRLARQALPAPVISKPRRNLVEKTRNILLVIVAVTLGILCLVVFAPLFGRTLFSQPIMGSAPLIDNSNPKIYAQPQNSGQMSTDGKITYAQSGKPNERTVTGYVADGQTIVCTAYRMSFQGDVLDNGVVLAFDGKFDLNKDPITLVDGACTLVASGAAQKKLDSMWVDFCRGDKDESTGWWSYEPWALSNVVVGDYIFPSDTSSCFKEADDIYPSFLPRPANTTQADQPETAKGDRLTTTGHNGPITFAAGVPVLGYKITLSNGIIYNQCYMENPEYSGTVEDGVIYPWQSEVDDIKACPVN